ncbi:MAG TPA: Gmad2 immunoglobulin-like domain-containing protein, partial [Anaerolineales bacterium]|nr:Gmad2 immunoglobulin-like domain-containing protein [Anaerolineales bacterium]
PQNGGTVTGGMAHVEGFALASFEQTLLAEILDADGNVIGSEAVIVQAPDLGQPGPFRVDIAYTATGSGPGRVVVRDPSPAFGGDTHLSSVEITLEP